MNKIILSLAMLLATATAADARLLAKLLPDSLQYSVRLGYNIGGTAPVGMPKEIRALNSYKLKSNLSYGVDVYKKLRGRFGLMTGLRLENKGMEIDATVKNYHISMTRGGETLTGYFTGRDVIEVDEWLLTVPVLATCDFGRWRLKFGPYVSYLLSRKFEGYAYDGYIRVGDPTGMKVELGHTETERGSYDFSREMRRIQLGVNIGADWRFSRRWGAYGDITWGVTGVHKSSFHTIEQTLYPIFGTIGATYKL